MPKIIAGLKHFRHRRHEVIVFHVLDPAELDFPFRDTTLFKGLEGLPDVLTEPHALRRAYQAEIGAFLDELKKGCRMIDIDYVPLRTDWDLDAALSSYLAARANRTPLRRRRPRPSTRADGPTARVDRGDDVATADRPGPRASPTSR